VGLWRGGVELGVWRSPRVGTRPLAGATAEEQALLAYVYCYDGRGGGVETSLHEDKTGLGLTRRNKKRWEGQQVLVYLSALAHNTLVWAREWLREYTPRVGGYGIKRLVRDVGGIFGYVECDPHGQIQRIVLNHAHRLAGQLAPALQLLLGREQVVITLGET
jgi:hypothetical protein